MELRERKITPAVFTLAMQALGCKVTKNWTSKTYALLDIKGPQGKLQAVFLVDKRSDDDQIVLHHGWTEDCDGLHTVEEFRKHLGVEWGQQYLTPGTLMTRVLKGLGLTNRGKGTRDFSIQGVYVHGERTRTDVVMYSRATENKILDNAELINQVAPLTGFGFEVKRHELSDGRHYVTMN